MRRPDVNPECSGACSVSARDWSTAARAVLVARAAASTACGRATGPIASVATTRGGPSDHFAPWSAAKATVTVFTASVSSPGDHEIAVPVLGEAGEHLQVLVGQHLRVGVVGMHRPEDPLQRLRLTVGLKIIACWRPSASRICLLRVPSAVRIRDCRSPSACRIAARLSRSARSCFSIASLIVVGGSIAFISTRFTRIPLAGGRVEHLAQPGVDGLPRREGALEVHRSDQVPQGGLACCGDFGQRI